MTRESWPYSGPRESLPRRAGYRSMRLKSCDGIRRILGERHTRKAR